MITNEVAKERFAQNMCPSCEADRRKSVRLGSRILLHEGNQKRTVVFYKCKECHQTYHVYKSSYIEVSFLKFGREVKSSKKRGK